MYPACLIKIIITGLPPAIAGVTSRLVVKLKKRSVSTDYENGRLKNHKESEEKGGEVERDTRKLGNSRVIYNPGY